MAQISDYTTFCNNPGQTRIQTHYEAYIDRLTHQNSNQNETNFIEHSKNPSQQIV